MIKQALLTKTWIRARLFEMNLPVEHHRKHGDNGNPEIDKMEI